MADIINVNFGQEKINRQNPGLKEAMDIMDSTDWELDVLTSEGTDEVTRKRAEKSYNEKKADLLAALLDVSDMIEEAKAKRAQD